MKYVKYIVFIIVSLFIVFPAYASDEVDIYLFYGETCPHCEAEMEYLNTIEDEYNINLIKYEIWNNNKNAALMRLVAEKYGVTVRGVPFTIIGNNVLTGFGEDTPNLIIEAIEKYDFSEESIIGKIIKGENTEEEKGSEVVSNTIKIPFIGEINLKTLSLPILSMVVGAVDGFNPCAMWVLLFLISMLIGMKNKKRMWILGSTFLIISALIYFLFLLTWFNVITFLGSIKWFQLAIAIVAIIGGIINLKSYIKTRKEADGCTVVEESKRKTTFAKIKKIVNEKSFIIAFIGVIGLALSVNVFELACSAGLPVVFIQTLAVNDITNTQYIIYLLIYIFFYLLDDMLIFFIAMISLKVTAFSTKYGKLSHLIGGVLMLLIGLLLIFKPEWLMFNF